MRVALALAVVALAAGALALADSSPARHARPAQVRLLAARSACSAAAECVQGCALAVASAPASPRSSTTPCSEQPQGGCAEYVAARPARPGASSCEARSPAYSEKLTIPLFRKDAERALRERLHRGSGPRRPVIDQWKRETAYEEKP